MWIKAYVITEAELWLLWETLPAIMCVIRSHESRCVWGLKCLGRALKAEIQMANNWCCRPSFTPLSTHLYSHDCRVDQQLSGPPQTGQSHWGPLAWRNLLDESWNVFMNQKEKVHLPLFQTLKTENLHRQISSMKNWIVLAQWLNWIIELSICFTWFIQPVNV